MASRAGLDSATVVRAAAVLADAQGLESLTLGEVAARLGVRTPSLYNHVAGLQGLRRALALYGTRELAASIGRAAIGKSQDDAVFALANAMRAFINAHPGLYAAMRPAARTMDPPDLELAAAEDNTVEIVLAVLASYGLQGDDALHATRGLRSAVHGFATLETSGSFGLSLDCDESFRRMIMTFVAGLRQAAHRMPY